MATAITVIGQALVIISAVLAWTICILYHLSARWWTSETGRHVMTFTATLALVLSVWTIGLFAQTTSPWWDVLRLAAFAGVPIGLAWRLRLLWQLQIRPGLRAPAPARRERDEPPPLFPDQEAR